MKSFLSALIIFSLILTASVGCHIFLKKSFTALTLLAAALPEDADAAELSARAAELEEFFLKRRPFFSLLIPADRLDKAENAISAVSTASPENYASARAGVFLSLTRLREAELFSLYGLL